MSIKIHKALMTFLIIGDIIIKKYGRIRFE